jgi:hypothetical protein
VRLGAATGLRAIALEEPTPAMRMALPPLKRLLGSWWSLNDEERLEYERALIAIENATAATKDLPLPGRVVPDDPVRLPIPGHSVEEARG